MHEVELSWNCPSSLTWLYVRGTDYRGGAEKKREERKKEKKKINV